MSNSLYSNTPSVIVLDNRGLTVRDIAYHRHPNTPDVTSEHITCHRYDARGFLAQSADPRLSAAGLANLTYLTNLAGQALRTTGVDNGTTISLNDAAGRPFITVSNISPAGDGPEDRGQAVTRTWQYENATLPGRPLSITEQVTSEAARITERFVYAGHGDAEKALNLAGACVSHYDTAGMTQTDSVALTGVPLSVSRCLLKEADNPGVVADWQGKDGAAWNDPLEAEAYTTRTTADATGAILTTTDAKGNLQRVAYDVTGLLSGSWLTLEGGKEQTVVKSLTYSAAGQKLREEHGNGVVTTYTYEAETQRLTRIKTERPAGHASGARVLQDLRYEYDPVGNVLKITNDAEEPRFWRNQKVVPENAYVYDSLYQLVRASGREMANPGQQGSNLLSATVPLPADGAAYTNYTRTYTYDYAGNLTQIRHSAPATNNSYTTDITVSDKSNRGVLSMLTENPSDVDALFTAGGQQTQLQPGQTLVWTPCNELLKVTPVVRDGGTDDRESYRYDAGRQRVLKVSVQKTGNSTQTQRVLYLPGLELRTMASGNTETESLQVITVGEAGRAQVRVLHWESGVPEGVSNDPVRYSYDNLTGSSQLELDGDGNIISTEEYYPYGGTAVWTVRSQAEAEYKTIRYSGKERDATGLYYYGYRYYQPWAGRWLSADPAGTVDGLNLFRMCRNNPVLMHDTLGLTGEKNHEGWSLVFGSQQDESMPMSTTDFAEVVSNMRPKIFIVGDGHASPPFKYAKDLPDVMKALKNDKLNLYVEFTEEGWAAQKSKFGKNDITGQVRELPAELMERRSWLNSNLKANVLPWEPKISTHAQTMADILMNNAIDIKGMSTSDKNILKTSAPIFSLEVSKYAKELAEEFKKTIGDILSSESKEAIDIAAKDALKILVGKWRDEYINKYLANKIANHAKKSPNETFLVSIGDAHLNESLGPLQHHLSNLRLSGEVDFHHQILINKNPRLGHA